MLNRANGMITILPSARIDAEWFKSMGISMVLDLRLRFYMTDGTQAVSDRGFLVTVVDIDDTPPQTLAFQTGGQVRADTPGAVIGTLAVGDPDTASGFTFLLDEQDAWQFEVVGNVLRLKQGVSLSLADGRERSITVTVSDGTQSSAFTLTFDVLPKPGVSREPIDYLVPGQTKHGFSWASPGVVSSFVPAWDIASIRKQDGLVGVTRDDGKAVWFEAPVILDLGSGYMDFRKGGEAATAWLIWETMLNVTPSARMMGSVVTAMRVHGATAKDFVDAIMTHYPQGKAYKTMSAADFVRSIYSNAVSWDIGQDAVTWHASRIQQGMVTREQFILDIVEWRRSLPEFETRAEQGFYVPRQHMEILGALGKVGMGLEFGAWSLGWQWGLGIGMFNLQALAAEVVKTPQFQARWGHMSQSQFFAGFFQEAAGGTLNSAALDAWSSMAQSGQDMRPAFMATVLSNLTPASEFLSLPQGPGFDYLW
ncbi:MAG: hypothetical protein N3D18_02525 [Roseococcus sp.]|nr:hypothetical protein [Roseococcus sp.]